jgi:hypothetical protein
LSEHTVPSGLVSVMPHACSTCTSKRSWNARIIAGGQAEPPITVRRIVRKPRPLASTCASRPFHTVGTPAESVTDSSSNNSCSDLPSSQGPGKTSFAPTMQATYGMPHAFTWNIGTTGRIVSRAEQPNASGSAAAHA